MLSCSQALCKFRELMILYISMDERGFKTIVWETELFMEVLNLGNLVSSILFAIDWPIFTKQSLKD